MPAIDLHLHEVEAGWMPSVCARCGRPGKYARAKTVVWSPWWVPLVVFFTGFLILLPFVRWLFIGTALAPDANRRVRLHLRFCKRHRNHWRWRAWLLTGVLLASLGLIAGGVIGLVAETSPEPATRMTCLQMIAGGLLGVVVWRVLATILALTAIRIKGVAGTALTLAGVAEEFCDAVAKRRRRKPKSGVPFEMSAYDERLRRRRERRLDSRGDPGLDW
jgi:hypothetical protein